MKSMRFILLAMAMLVAPMALAQSSSTEQTQQEAQQQPEAVKQQMHEPAKVMREFNGVKLGMKSEEVQAALGKPARLDKKQNSAEFKLDGGDLMTVHYNKQGAVKIIQLYFSDAERAPKFEDVVGDAEIQQRPNGSKYARRVVGEEKFWVTMYQSKSGAVTTVTISRSS